MDCHEGPRVELLVGPVEHHVGQTVAVAPVEHNVDHEVLQVVRAAVPS